MSGWRGALHIAANDRQIEYINDHALPSGAKRLLVAELKATRPARFYRKFHRGAAHH